MKTVANPSDLAEVLARIEKLQEETPRQWGTMNAAQMLWHCRQQLSLGTGGLKVKSQAPRPVMWLLKKTLAGKVPFGKNMGTVPGIEAGAKSGLEFQTEKSSLISEVKAFAPMKDAELVKEHPFFGKMDAEGWKQIVYKHLDHHLRQFGL